MRSRRSPSTRDVLQALLLAGLLPSGAVAADALPALDALLDRAGAQAEALEERLAVVTATERHEQKLLFGAETRPARRRTIVSEVVWVPTGDAMIWAFFRDVVSVDGTAVADRSVRLDRLFAHGATAEARLRAGEWLDASARYNLGPRRTVNTPVFGLSVLHPRNRRRFRFEHAGTEKKDGVPAARIRFAEQASPALVRTSAGADLPTLGVLWIEPATGALVASELHIEASARDTRIDVRFRRDERLEAWLPVEMQEWYGERGQSERVEAVAHYSNLRRGGTEVEIIFPKR
ncbi:MAG: hypothetical protein ABW221_20680 [Vicinamibacteria bacterium]